ncbi:MAG: biotin/lipoyl-containing protein [Trueperaceae bacterium]|nr:biotin/lipoyl-containing protein [Trueperaceae bacterium]
MIHASSPKRVAVMLTAFRDGLQSVFGGKVRVADVLPAMEAASAAGVRHFEFGGGARFQAPFFYVGEDPFEAMDAMRAAVGPDADLQILTRSISGVTLTSQTPEALALQARLMAKHGTTIDRNFDFMNDVGNLLATGRPIVEAGMHHQATVALMGLPYASERVHTPAFYADVARGLLDGDVRIDSIALKDASGTTDPATVYETAKRVKALTGSEVPVWFHTHDTASMAVACTMAAIHGGVDGVDLSVRPLASGTSQPDVRSVAHALKGTGYGLDLDADAVGAVEGELEAGLADYAFDPITLAADARVVGFPMPGGAIGPNVLMMKEAGILDRYAEVLAEFPVVVEAGGAWTSVTPGSQQYWLQAFDNVLYGRWTKIDAGYGRSVLGYFGRPPEPPDPEVVRIASEQLGLAPFDGDPSEVAEDGLAPAREALRARGLPETDEHVFLVAAAIVPGKAMDLNEGIRLLEGRPRIKLPLRTPEGAEVASGPASGSAAPWTTPVTRRVTVTEGGATRTFDVTLAPPGAAPEAAPAPVPDAAPAPAAGGPATPVHSPFGGTVEVLAVRVGIGEAVAEGQVVATVEAMKAEHDVRSPVAGVIASVDVRPGDEVGPDVAIVTVGG